MMLAGVIATRMIKRENVELLSSYDCKYRWYDEKGCDITATIVHIEDDRYRVGGFIIKKGQEALELDGDSVNFLAKTMHQTYKRQAAKVANNKEAKRKQDILDALEDIIK